MSDRYQKRQRTVALESLRLPSFLFGALVVFASGFIIKPVGILMEDKEDEPKASRNRSSDPF